MDFETEKQDPAYATIDLKPGELRILSFENDSREPVEKELARYGLRAVQAWSSSGKDVVQIDKRGNLRFFARPGSTVFAIIKSA